MWLSWLLLTGTLTTLPRLTTMTTLPRPLSGLQGRPVSSQVEDVGQSSQKSTLQHLTSKKRGFARPWHLDESRNPRINLVDLRSNFPDQEAKGYQDMTKATKASYQTHVKTTITNAFTGELDDVHVLANVTKHNMSSGTSKALVTAGSEDDSVSGSPSLGTILDKGVQVKPDFPWTMSQSKTRARRMANQIKTTVESSVSRTTEDPRAPQGLASLGTSSSTGNSVVDSEFRFRRIQREFCPFTKLCSEPAPKRFPDDHTDVTPCCMPCSCEASCRRKGTCCPDVELQTPEDVPATGLSNCMPAVYPRDQTGSRVQGYDVVNDCPSGYQNRSVWQRCLGETPEIFLDLVFVTDNETNRIYANRFCALCHGVSDTILYWGIKEATCNHFDTIYALKYLYETQTAYDLFKTVMELKCSIELKPPAYLEVQSEVCYIHDKLVTNCNETGLLDNYSESVQSRCRSHLAPYLHQTFDETTSRFDTVYYGNLYCYLCNVPSTRAVTPNDTCFLPENDTGSRQLPPDTAIFDLDPLLHIVTKNISNDSNGRCIHVNLTTGDCVMLRCPILSVQHGSECIQVFRDVTDLYFFQTFNVTFRYSTQIQNNPDILTGAIDKYFFTNSEFAASSCSVSSLTIFFLADSACEVLDADCDVLVNVIIQAKQTICPITQLVKLLYWYMTTEVTAEIDTPASAVKLTISMTPGVFGGDTREVYTNSLQSVRNIPLVLSPTFHCPATAMMTNGSDVRYPFIQLEFSCTEHNRELFQTTTGARNVAPTTYAGSMFVLIASICNGLALQFVR